MSIRLSGEMLAASQNTPQDAPEPQGPLYRIGDVSRLTDTKPFVLRYWETEFPFLQPVKTPKGHRLYRPEDVELILAIKRLLYEEGFTIAGARRHLAEVHAAGRGWGTAEAAARGPELVAEVEAAIQNLPQEDRSCSAVDGDAQRALRAVRTELRAILTLLQGG